MTLAILAMTIIFLTGVAWGWSGSERQLADLIISAESLSVVFAVIFLFLVSANEERKEALKSYANQIDQLEGIVKKVRADERTKTEFLAILAHELRNPLSPLLSSIELLRFKGANREERIKILTAMEERVNTMDSLLDDLLDISRITRKKLKLSRQVIDVSSIAKRAIASIDPLFESKEHSLHVAVPKEPFYVYVDPLRLEQIIVNLLTNAAKYTDEGGDILFSLRRRGEEMEIHVKDNGIGISPNVIRLIFEPFIQLNQSVNRSGSGLGIGLSLTKRLVELHGGRITAESRGKDMGTEFIVRIPAPQAVQLPMPKTEGEKAVVAKATTATQMRVLVVDDNEAAAEGIEELLKIKGYEVAVAFNGKDALRAVQRFDPRAIVLDIGLPDMSGHEVAKTLRLNGSKAFLIALSGYGQEEDKLKARESGFDRHLTKPAGINALERELKEAYAMLPHGPDNHRQGEQQLVGARPAT
jgi:signal transduction histidine kinase/ActR/RegA family two-component response regulator